MQLLLGRLRGRRKKLRWGARIIFLHPEWNRTCKDCCTWIYHSEKGPLAGKRVTRGGTGGAPLLEMRRLPWGKGTPCDRCPKIPDHLPKERWNAVEISERNWLALIHHLECRAVGQFPDDPIVRRNARIIKDIVDASQQKPLLEMLGAGLFANARE